MNTLTSLPNIGKILAENLRQVGIDNPEALEALGAKETFLRIRAAVNPEACLHQLYALEGAIQGVRYTLLSDEKIRELRAFYKGL